MWLLDANLDVRLAAILLEYGVRAETTGGRGWKKLSDKELVGVACASGFTCLLTRDRLFGESASKALKAYPNFAVILIILPQQRSAKYNESFRAAWARQPIQPKAGELMIWPGASA